MQIKTVPSYHFSHIRLTKKFNSQGGHEQAVTHCWLERRSNTTHTGNLATVYVCMYACVYRQIETPVCVCIYIYVMM